METIGEYHFKRAWAERNCERVHVFANGHVYNKAERRKTVRQLIAMMRRERA